MNWRATVWGLFALGEVRTRPTAIWMHDKAVRVLWSCPAMLGARKLFSDISNHTRNGRAHIAHCGRELRFSVRAADGIDTS